MAKVVSDIIKRENCIYTSFYCEENIWKLCEQIENIDSECLNNCYVIFVSNHEKHIPIWYQKAGNLENEYLCVWDYHVFMVEKTSIGALVYDLDTVLDFPVMFDYYVFKAIKPEFNHSHKRMFRIVPSKLYLTFFASDRSHMKTVDGKFIKKPPPYPEISTQACKNNIREFISMNADTGCGFVKDLKGFVHYFQDP